MRVHLEQRFETVRNIGERAPTEFAANTVRLVKLSNNHPLRGFFIQEFPA